MNENIPDLLISRLGKRKVCSYLRGRFPGDNHQKQEVKSYGKGHGARAQDKGDCNSG
jgi:hypothetical protein